MKSLEQSNMETVSAFIEAFWNRSEWDCADRFLSDDYVELSYQSKDGLKTFAAKIMDAFPDKRYEVEEIIGQGDKVLVRMTVKGTHQGMFFGTAPTGNQIDVTLYRQYRVADGLITEHRGWIDMVTMWNQIQGNRPVA
ncbi:ester cyclase [Brevibacillus choshinensis]|uniref:Ester cyclase n=2 Tax=Brevibacillus choshinensis TaxID=54911 RepID=A0ABX7FYB3_BRECH|nr:ester cyclase [Brevibacillus choshinensis]QRG70798.1 ester cyclase [Brevibacillus choshinensis]